MGDLSSKYGGLKVKNPLVCASGPPTHTHEACLRAARAGFAGVVLKTNSREAPDTLLHTMAWPAPAIPIGEHLILEHFQNYKGPF